MMANCEDCDYEYSAEYGIPHTHITQCFDYVKSQLTAAKEEIETLKRQDEVHWKTRRILLALITGKKGVE